MLYRPLGNTGLNISEIGFGSEHLEGKSFELVDAVVNTALDGGVNIIDVFMPQPEVRSNIGRAIGSRRKDVIIQGHIGAAVRDGQYARSRDPGECDIFIKDFLERFNTDYIDLGMLHFIDTEQDYESAFRSAYIDYAISLKEKGVVRFLGASSHNPITAIKMVNSGLVDMLLFSINPAFDLGPSQDIYEMLSKDTKLDKLEIDPKRIELYNLCAAKGVGITVMKTLGAGRLLSAEASSLNYALTIPQCVSYALDRPAVSSVLLGAQTAEEMKQAIAYENTTADERDYTVLTSGGLPLLNSKCMYCNHCLPCPVGIDVASVTKYLDMASVSNADTVSAHYDTLSTHGSDCIECGSCEANCPFGVNVRENMRAAANMFGK